MVLWVAFLLIMASAPPAGAGIVVHIADSADPDTSFWVETKSNHALLHGLRTDDSKLVREMPSALKTVRIPTFTPRSWRDFVASGQKVHQTTYADRWIEERRQKDPVYARKLDQREQQHLKELRDLLSEIKALLALDTEERLRLRSLQAKLARTSRIR